METIIQIMGICNVTPDSFSDGGKYTGEAALDARIDRLLAEGADIIDVGGESTRPFAEPIHVDEELARVIPTIRKIRRRSSVPISIDTTKAAVAQAALDAGATIINDISALRQDPGMIEVLRQHACPVVIMHMQGTPGTMQVQPCYGDVIAEINLFLAERIDWMGLRGIGRDRIIVDPGIGFGKSLAHNLSIVRNIAAFKSHGCRVLIGHSRKSFFGQLLDLAVDERDCATAVVSVFCAKQGCDILRVHEVGLSRQALILAETMELTEG